MADAPEQLYLDLMSAIRDRLDAIDKFASSAGGDFARAEAAAFQGRKVIEGIAFACLVATEKGLKHIPRDAKGHWNAESILKSLSSKNINTFPSPSIIRKPTEEEHSRDNVNVVIEGVPERRISADDLIEMYQRMHRWLHELNPYVAKDRATFYSTKGQQLWSDLSAIGRFIERHFISIKGIGFFCVLRDINDGQTKVLPLQNETVPNPSFHREFRR
jgi:hypothetical protein